MFSMNRLAKLALTTSRTANSLRSFSTTLPTFSSSSPPAVESDLTHPALMKDPPITNPSTETDPWSLAPPPFPEVNEDGSDLSMADLILSPHPEGRDNEPTETLRKRLIYESRKRGILEMELILSTFAKTRLGTLTDRELREYDRVSYVLLLLSLSLSLSLSLPGLLLLL